MQSFWHSSTSLFVLGRFQLRYLGGTLLIIMVLTAASWDVYAQESMPTVAQLPAGKIRHNYQTWNNCGGANLTMAMSYYGWTQDQDVARSWLKPDDEDKNVSPGEMAAFVNNQSNLGDIRAVWRYGGDLDLIKRAIAAGFPVIAESGYDVDDLDWMGHYETVVGYDDASQTIYVYDSYKGPDQVRTYTEFDTWWRHFNRTYIILFPLSREANLRAVLGPHVDPLYAAQTAFETARQEAVVNPSDAWAWFNMGTSLVRLGNFTDAATAFDEAFSLGLPYRLMWYMFGPYEAYYNVGRFDDVLMLANNTESTTPYVEETNYWRGMVYAARGQTDLALDEFNQALAFNPNFSAAQDMKMQIVTNTFMIPVLPDPDHAPATPSATPDA